MSIYILDENGDPIWDEALDPIGDGVLTEGFIDGGYTFYAAPHPQSFTADSVRQGFSAVPTTQSFTARS